MSAYAVIADLARFGLPAAALASVPDADKTAAITAASGVADSFFRARYGGPLQTWDLAVTRAVVAIANYDLLSSRGYNPAVQGSDGNVRLRYQDAIAWLQGVARQDIHPVVTLVEAQSPEYDAPRAISYPKQGW